jgi:hypothetical protein
MDFVCKIEIVAAIAGGDSAMAFRTTLDRTFFMIARKDAAS